MAKTKTTKERARTRRLFLQKASVAGAAIAGTMVAGLGGFGTKARAQRKKKTKHMVMIIDLTRCTGCQACAIACKAEHNVRLGGFRSQVSSVESGVFPKAKRFSIPRLCNHCSDSSCQKVCPTGATYEREDGIVAIDKDKCIGCRYCMVACPYDARYFNWDREETEDLARTPGTVDKCDFCSVRLDKGLVPACVQTCPAVCRFFGDANDPQSEVSRLLAKHPTQTLLPEMGTKPNVYYIGLDAKAVAGIFGGRS